jgi:hypothetical protein
MTTKEAEQQYLAQHLGTWGGKGYAIYNPHQKPEYELPWIIGFNNGGEPGWYHAQLIAEDGMGMGSHLCSHEGYMTHDLGILEGARSDRHEHFRAHYPDGYRMDFAPYDDPRIQAAIVLNKKLAEAAETTDA